jgi:hypothetical protein
MAWAKAGDHASSAKAAHSRTVAVIRSPCPSRQSFAGGKLRIKIAFEACRRLCALDHDQIVVLALEAGRGKVRGSRAKLPPVDFVALEVHRIAGLVLDPYLDAGRLGEVIENLCWRALGKLSPVEIDADRNATIGGARERLHDGPVRQDIRGHVDFMLGAID